MPGNGFRVAPLMTLRGPALLFSCLVFAGSALRGEPSLPRGFTAWDVAPGVVWDDPVGLAFAADGSLFVAEKKGVVWVVRGEARLDQPFISLENEVLSNGERGLLGVAVDPRFAENGFVYLLYTVDPDGDGADDEEASFGRLTRYQASVDDPGRADLSTRRVLLGATWASGIPAIGLSHGPGSLVFGTDGTLLVSAGDAARSDVLDTGGLDPAAFGPGRFPAAEDIGSLRALWTGSLAGKVLRIDPTTGGGLPSNPYYTGNPYDAASRVWAYGLRNPFRMGVRPGTGAADPDEGYPGALFIGDVGWNTWEELDLSLGRGGENFGWPCMEGALPTGQHAALPLPSRCSDPPGPGNPAPPSDPMAAIHHEDPFLSSIQGATARAISGIAFHESGAYPPAYTGSCFIADHVEGWIKSLALDGENGISGVVDFAEGASGPADLAADPITSEIVCASLGDDRVYRFRYERVNSPPVAQALAAPSFGPAPLQVQFTSLGTTDPDGDPLEYVWDFGDGEGSTLENPGHTYTSPGQYTAALTVSDPDGEEATVTVTIWVETSGIPTPPRAVIQSIDPSPAVEGDLVSFVGRGVAPGPGASFLWISSLDGVLSEAPEFTTSLLSAGVHSISFFALAGTGGASPEARAVLIVEPEAASLDVIVDNDDRAASFTGSWWPSSAPGAYGGSSLFSKHIGDTASFEPSLAEPGIYEVHAWWTSLPSRALQAPFVITYDDGTDEVRVNQRRGGGRWRLLGAYRFDETARIELSASGGGESTCADAVRLVRRPQDILIDDGDRGTSFTGEWSASQGTNPYGRGSVFALDQAGTYRYAFSPEDGDYEVFAWWTSSPKRSNQVRYEVTHAGGGTIITVNQRSAAGQWNLLGEFSFRGNGAVTIQALDDSTSYCADAIYLRKVR